MLQVLRKLVLEVRELGGGECGEIDCSWRLERCCREVERVGVWDSRRLAYWFGVEWRGWTPFEWWWWFLRGMAFDREFEINDCSQNWCCRYFLLGTLALESRANFIVKSRLKRI